MPLAVPLLDRARALPVPLPALVRQAPDPPRTGEAATGVRSRRPETRLTGCCCRSDFTPPLRCSRPPNARAIGVEAGAARGRRDRADVHTFFILVCRAGGARSLNTCTVCGLETELSKPQPTRPAATRSPSGRRTPWRGRHLTAGQAARGHAWSDRFCAGHRGCQMVGALATRGRFHATRL
jgi:hypothetical protein